MKNQKQNFKQVLRVSNYGQTLNNNQYFGFTLSGDGTMKVAGLAEKRPLNNSFDNFWMELTPSIKRDLYKSFLKLLSQGYRLN